MIGSSATKLKVSDSSSKLYRSDISSISTVTFQAFPAITFLPLVTDIFLLHSIACANIASAVPATLELLYIRPYYFNSRLSIIDQASPFPFNIKRAIMRIKIAFQILSLYQLAIPIISTRKPKFFLTGGNRFLGLQLALCVHDHATKRTAGPILSLPSSRQ
jgi:hypothetical protein